MTSNDQKDSGNPSYTATCNGEVIPLAEMVMDIAKNLEAQEFKYESANTADCSGMFHRFLQALKVQCPDGKYPNTYDQLVNLKYRDTRGLAKWYQEEMGGLTLVKHGDAAKMGALIKPGAVIFYGYSDRIYHQPTLDQLYQRGKGINHVGVVVSVEKNSQGEVINYHLFHGRNPKYTAGITSFHHKAHTQSDRPPFGNGREPMVAISQVIR